MRRAMSILGVGLLVVAAAACGRSEAEKQAEEAAKAAEEAARGLEEMAKGFEGLFAGDATAEETGTVELVSFRELQAVFPDLPGWTKGRPTGEQMSSPVRFSQAEVSYTRDDATIEVSVIDSALSQLVLAPYSAFLVAGYERETDSGYEKSTEVAGHPGWERWNREGRDGELNALVNKRFLMTLQGNGIDDPAILHQLAGRIDLGKLGGPR